MLVGALVASMPGCHGCREPHEERDDESEEQEEQNARRLNYWRVQVSVVGDGVVKTLDGSIDCSTDPAHEAHRCGPHLFTFEELQPPLLRGTGAAGWKLARWESQTRQADGHVMARSGPMPDGRWYLNGFGYQDTGALETVTAVFVPTKGAPDDRASDAAQE
ncbi:MAG: hypothetical protein JO257_33965 [Deltaproteobacteria bacterium]|nr:hypothetical protein [Deltaproteobacteria bacterium]